MNEQVAWSLIFSLEQIHFLTGLLQADGFIGIKNPFVGLDTAQLENRMSEAQKLLVQLGYLAIETNGNLSLELAVSTVIKTVSSAKRILAVSKTSSDRISNTCLIYLTAGLILEQQEMSNNRVALTAVRDLDIVVERVRDFINLAETSSPANQAFTLDEHQLNETRNLASNKGKDACRAFLEGLNVLPETANLLASVLTSQPVTGSLTLLQRDGKEIVFQEGMAWIVGPQGGWCVFLLPAVQGEPVSLRLIPATTADIIHRMSILIKAAETKALSEQMPGKEGTT